MKTQSLFFAAMCAVGISSSAKAQLINVDFGPSGSPVMSGAAVLGQAGDAWNAISSDQNGVALLNSTGTAVSGTSWTYTTGHNLFDSPTGSGTPPSPTSTNPTALMEDYMYGTAGNEGGTIFGLTPGDSFTLVVYGAGDHAGQGDQMSLSGDMTGGNSGATLFTTGEDRDISNGIGDAYNIFTGTVGSSGQIQIVTSPFTTDGSTNSEIEGFQLQESAVPEPGTYGLLGIGAGMLLLMNKRRQLS